MMFRRICLLALAAVALLGAGCNLDSPATALPSPSPTQAPSGPGQTTAPDPAECPIPASWVAYTVAPGDNLTLIASSIESTVDELVAGNCLANPDALQAGQTLYLPRLPGD